MNAPRHRSINQHCLPIITVLLLLFSLQFAFATPTTPTSDFTDNQDGTVTHKTTGLTWMRCAMGQTWTGTTCSGIASFYTYDAAVALTHTFAGRSDWRLPNIAELQTIVERENVSPAINTTLSPNASTASDDWFWSSSPYANNRNNAWIVHFYDGIGKNKNKNYDYRVRLVRGGQWPLGSLVNDPTHVVLFLHGMNSNIFTWNDVVTSLRRL